MTCVDVRPKVDAGESGVPPSGGARVGEGRYRRSVLRIVALVERLRRWPSLVVNAVLVLVLIVPAMVEALYPTHGYNSPTVLSVALSLLTVAPLLVQDRYPVTVLAVTMLSYAGLILGDYNIDSVISFGWVIALYTVAERRPLAWSLPCLLLGEVLLSTSIMVLAQTGREDVRLDHYLVILAVPILAWGTGLAYRRLREYATQLEGLTHTLRAEQAARAERAVLQERSRIARELHDVVAHHVGAIAMQANAAKLTVRGQPELAESSLDFIYSTSRDAMAEMRRLIGILHSGDTGDDGLAPAPTLSDVGSLAALAADAGLPTELETVGEARQLPPALELSAYRIVQEALTNSMKHAGPARVLVTVHYHPDRLDLQVTDTGRGLLAPDGDGGGQGLVGMRERAALFNGTLRTGPRPGGGYEVAASLPVPGETQGGAR